MIFSTLFCYATFYYILSLVPLSKLSGLGLYGVYCGNTKGNPGWCPYISPLGLFSLIFFLIDMVFSNIHFLCAVFFILSVTIKRNGLSFIGIFPQRYFNFPYIIVLISFPQGQTLLSYLLQLLLVWQTLLIFIINQAIVFY